MYNEQVVLNIFSLLPAFGLVRLTGVLRIRSKINAIKDTYILCLAILGY